MINTKKPHSLNISSFFIIFCRTFMSFFGAKSAGIHTTKKMTINDHRIKFAEMVTMKKIRKIKKIIP